MLCADELAEATAVTSARLCLRNSFLWALARANRLTPLSVRTNLQTTIQLIADPRLLVNRSISCDRKPGGSVLVSKGGSVSVSVRDRGRADC